MDQALGQYSAWFQTLILLFKHYCSKIFELKDVLRY